MTKETTGFMTFKPYSSIYNNLFLAKMFRFQPKQVGKNTCVTAHYEIIDGENNEKDISVSFSFCSPLDNYSRKVGKQQALKNRERGITYQVYYNPNISIRKQIFKLLLNLNSHNKGVPQWINLFKFKEIICQYSIIESRVVEIYDDIISDIKNKKLNYNALLKLGEKVGDFHKSINEVREFLKEGE